MTKYLCVWDITKYKGNFYEICNDDFFNINNGYNDNEISKILNLKIGEMYILPDIGETHIIIRLGE